MSGRNRSQRTSQPDNPAPQRPIWNNWFDLAVLAKALKNPYVFGIVALGISGVTATAIGVSASASCAIVLPLSGLVLLSQWMANWKEVKLKELAF